MRAAVQFGKIERLAPKRSVTGTPRTLCEFEPKHLNLKIAVMTNVQGDVRPTNGVPALVKLLGSKMDFFQQSLAAVNDRAANLIAQLCELNQLRERFRKAQLSARRSRRRYRRTTTRA